MPVINDAYYLKLGDNLRGCAVEDFSAIVSEHKTNMLATKFTEPSDKVFEKNLSWLAQEIVMQPGGRNFKEPADVTDDDLRKLETLRTEYGFDYLKDLS